MKTLYSWSGDLYAHKAIVKFLENKINKITEKEFNAMVDYFWLRWTFRYDLSPCGHLTHKGKLEFLEDNKEKIRNLIDEQQ